MNERIQQLAEQAEEEAYAEYAKKETGYTFQQLFLNKFVELIVKDCAEYVKNTNCFAYASQADLCAERMKQHFGEQK